MSKRSIIILAIVGLILIGFSLGTAQRSGVSPKREATPIPADKIVPLTPPVVTGEKDYCLLAHTNWSLQSYFGGWNVGDKVAIFFDPTDCEYPQNYPFQLTDVKFYLYNFAGVESVDVRFSVEIVCPDICDGPGIEIYKSPIYTITTFYPDIDSVFFPDTICLDKPFFFNLEYMSGIPGSIPSVIFDDQEDMVDTCYQWVWLGQPAWYEWYDFWAPPASGWIVLGISGYCGEAQTECGEWYWKPDTLPQAPSGMPDFDQNQDAWVAYCGPTAVANCLWWFDAVPPGWTPPQLIDTLARYFHTNPSWGTYVDTMQMGLDQYFADYGFAFKETTYVAPNFYEMEESLKVCQDIILLLAFWGYDSVSGWWPEGGHFVTMAGVNSEKKEIAISDPDRDQCVQYPWWPGRVRPPEHPDWGAYGPDLHNNPTYVSHDVYISLLDPEFPSPSNEWWELADYCYEPGKYLNMNVPERFRAFTKAAPKHLEYYRTEVEAAVMICPTRECPSDTHDLGICDSIYIETFDCDHEYQATPGSFDSVRVAIYVTHDSNTFWDGSQWVQDSIRAFVVPLTFWHQPPGCADSVILPNWDNWNNDIIDPGHPMMSRSMFRHIVDEHTGDTVYNRLLQMVEAGKGPWMVTTDIESHSSDGDSGHVFLSLIAFINSQAWWEGSRELLATLTFHVYMSDTCDTTEIGLDSTFWPPSAWLYFARYDAVTYVPRHLLPVKDTIYAPPKLVDVIAGEDQTGATKEDVSVMFYIQNIGTATDTFDLDITSSLGWDIEPQHLELTLDPGESDSVSVTISIPNVALGTSDWITLEATPQSNPNAGDSDSLTVTCNYYTIKILQTADVPNDQGKQVRIQWLSFTDFDSSVAFFTIFRRIDSLLVASGVSVPNLFEVSDLFDYPPGQWEVVGTIPAFGETLYATIVPTLKDSTISEGMYYTVFFIRAGTGNPYVYYDSPIDSGYSVDNLSPSPPAGLFASHQEAATKLTWSPTSALDFDYYTLYRGDTSGFTPNPSNRLGFTTDTTFVDSTAELGRTYYYLASATDFSGNESDPSNEAVGARYITGDTNGDGVINSADVVYLINYLFKGGPAPEPLEAGDCNCDGVVNSADVVYLINYLFKGGPPPGCD